jgi:hypothetical protein
VTKKVKGKKISQKKPGKKVSIESWIFNVFLPLGFKFSNKLNSV